jgi:hypothetical protein
MSEVKRILIEYKYPIGNIFLFFLIQCQRFCEMNHVYDFCIYQWVEDKTTAIGSPPVKVENPNQFAPQGDNPKELKVKCASQLSN